MKKFQFIALAFLLCYFCSTPLKAQTGPFDAFIEFANCSQTACISATGGCPPYNYTWCDASTVVDPCYGNTFLPTCAVCSVLVSDACSNTKMVVIEKPSISISTTPPLPSIACSGTATVNIICFGCNPSTGNTYQWNTQPAQTTQTATGLCCNETYCVTVTNCYGNKWSCCVTMPPGFSVDAGPDLTICEGEQVNLSGSGCNGNIQWYSYTAGGNNTAIAGANGALLTQSPLADICYIFECCQLNGCCDRDTVCVTVWPKPQISVVPYDPPCNGGTGGFDLNMSNVTVFISPCPTIPCTYFLTSPIGVSGYPAGMYTIIVTGANGCTATATYTINPGPKNIHAGNDIVVCEGGLVLLQSSGCANTIQWYEAGNSVPINGATNASYSFYALTSKCYVVECCDIFGCCDRDTVCVTVLPKPMVSVVPNDPPCNGSIGGFDLNMSNVIVSISPCPSPPCTFNLTNPIGVSGYPAGTYTITVTGTNGCTSTAIYMINPGPKNIHAGSDITVCEGDNVILQSSGCVNNIQWYEEGNPAPINGATNAAYSFTALSSKCYVVECCDAFGCCDKDTVCVTVWPKPVINVVVFNPLCHNTTGGFDLNMSNVTVSISPCPATQCTYFLTNPIGVSGYPAGTYTITVTGANGCTASASYTINPGPPALNMTAIPVNPLCCGDNGAFSLNVTGGTPGYTVHIVGLRTYNAVNVFYSNSVFPFSTNLDFPADNYLVIFCDATGCCDTLYRTITDPPCLQMIIQTYNDSCYHGCKGMFRVWGSGGTPVNSPQPYAAHLISQPVNGCPSLNTYNEPGQYDEFFQLGAGAYVVELVDGNGCTVTASVTITEPPFIVALVNTVPPACYGGNGAFSFSISGGTPGYKIHIVGTDAATNSIDTYYNYNTGQNPFSTFQLFPPGSYSITICDTNNCCFTISRTIAQTGSIGAVKFVKNGCRNSNNGSISLTASGGNPPYSYQWNTVPVKTTSLIFALSAGTYIVTITDANGCTKKDTSIIVNPSTNMLLNSNKTNVRCFGASTGDAAVIPSGGSAPYLYNWSNGKTTSAISNLVAGVYTCTVTDQAACTKSVIITITQNQQVMVTTTQINVTFPGGSNGTASASVTGGVYPYTYSWNTIPVKTTSTVTGLTAGTYKLTISDSKSCQQKITYFITEPVSKMNEESLTGSAKIEVSPNPTKGVVFINFNRMTESLDLQLWIYDITGRILDNSSFNKPAGPFVLNYDLGALSKGIYFMMITNVNGSEIHKIVLE